MTVDELLHELATAPHDAVVLIPASDHSYIEAEGVSIEVVYHKRYGWFEYYGDEDLKPGEKKMTAFVVSAG